MSNYCKKFVLSFLASLILLFSFAPYWSANAQATAPAAPAATGSWYNQDFFSWYGKVYDTSNSSEIFGERYTAAQVQWVVYGLVSMIFNMTGSSDIFSCVMSNSGDLSGCTNAIKKVFASSAFSSNMAQTNQNESIVNQILADRPISGIGYVREKVNNFRLIPEAKAQAIGFGFGALSPIQDMWRGSRNVAFGLFVLASILFAFMIMFRVKINPQTVVTVQSAIPKVVTALILVTFSYAIAGFMIDLMYVVIGILSAVLSTFIPKLFDPTAVFNLLVYGQPLGSIQVGIIGFLMIITLPFWIGLLVLVFVGILAGLGTSTIGFWIIMIPVIISAIVLLWICVKTIWGLFKAFANIVLLTVFGPLQIAIGILIPNFGFGAWVRSYISQLSVFIVTGVIGYMSLIFTIQGIVIGTKNINGGQTFFSTLLTSIFTMVPGLGAIAPFVTSSSPWPPLLGSGNGAWIGILFLGVAFVLFTMIPKATEVVAAFLSGKPFAYGSGIGEAVGTVTTLGRGALAWKVDRHEKSRQRVMGDKYDPETITKVLRTLNIIK